MPQITLVVTYADHQTGYFQVPEGESWRVDPATRCLVVGRGVPRTHVPLDSVQSFDVVHEEAPAGWLAETPRRGEVHACLGCGKRIAWNGSRWVDDEGQADTAGFCPGSKDPDPAHEPVL